MAMGVTQPKKISAHGQRVGAGGLKMFKSIGNVIDPVEVVETYSAFTQRLYIARHAEATGDSHVTMDLIERAYTNALVTSWETFWCAWQRAGS